MTNYPAELTFTCLDDGQVTWCVTIEGKPTVIGKSVNLLTAQAEAYTAFRRFKILLEWYGEPKG